MLTIAICVLSIENKKRKNSILNRAQNEEDYCGETDRGGGGGGGGKGLQTTWCLLLIV